MGSAMASRSSSRAVMFALTLPRWWLKHMRLAPAHLLKSTLWSAVGSRPNWKAAGLVNLRLGPVVSPTIAGAACSVLAMG